VEVESSWARASFNDPGRMEVDNVFGRWFMETSGLDESTPTKRAAATLTSETITRVRFWS
jgi:hypothetical protein